MEIHMIDDPGFGAALDDALSEVKRYARIEDASEDALIAALAASAARTAEAFLAQTLVRRSFAETVPVGRDWRRLSRTPVASIASVQGIDPAGTAYAIGIDAYAIDIDADGDGWVRVPRLDEGARALITYEAGMAAAWGGLPEMIRQGIVRLAVHLHRHRDADDDAGPPAAVAALLRPWRRMPFGLARRRA